jgi:carbon-monoxide dehydrogenase iron sulfur subunit
MIYVDVERCVGCLSCMIACAVEHSATKNLYTAIAEKPTPKPRIKVYNVAGVNVPMRCLHCASAPCIEVCPTGAMHRTEEGFVVVDYSKCIGCGLCSLVCPIGHPIVDRELGKIVKCDFCVDRVRAGKKPACVEACPVGALIFGETEEVMEYIRRRQAEAIAKARILAHEVLSTHPFFARLGGSPGSGGEAHG